MHKKQLLLEGIVSSIEDIEYILDSQNIKITQAIEDIIIKPAIRMHLIRIAEFFNKLKYNNEFEVLSKFQDYDLRGISAVRNYIAHDYDSTDDSIIEDVLRYDLPRIKATAHKILKDIDNK